MNLTPQASKSLAAYSANMAKTYGVDDVSKTFSISAPVETKLRAKMLESVEFLSLITTLPVDQIKGQVVSVGNTGIATGRKKGGRHSSGQSVSGNTYELVETDSVAELTWATLAAWANAGDQKQFQKLMSQNATKRFALDILRIGFNGTSVAETTDPDANPLGQDVNIGWHQYVKSKKPSQIMTDAIHFDPDGTDSSKYDYKTLDAMATELKNSLIHEALRQDPRLVVLVGADLVAAQQSRLMNAADTPSERLAAMQLDKNIAGMKSYVPPFFPGKRMAVTTLDNLHAYTQRGTSHRKSENVEDRKQWEDKYLRWEGYCVEELEAYAAIDESAITIGSRD